MVTGEGHAADGGAADHGPPTVTPEIGALEDWWAQLLAGVRTPYDFDPLWRAACVEARARDALGDGQFAAPNKDRRAAAAIIMQVVVESTP